jgi:amino acid permease
MLAAGYSDAAGNLTASHGSVLGIAVGALTLVILVHMSFRRGGILLNDIFAICKVFLLVAIVVIGFVFRGGGIPQKDHLGGQNYDPKSSWPDRAKTLSSYTQSLLIVIGSFGGYKQPFYVSN